MSTCWPGRWPGQSATWRTRLLTRGVSAMTSRTSAVCHRRRFGPTTGRSVASISLFSPRIAVHVIAEFLPESGLVVIDELQTAYPLGALPEIEVRNEQPSRTAVLGSERLAFIARSDHRLAVEQVLDGKIAIATDHGEGGGRLRQARRFEQRIDRHALPIRVELRPGCHTVNVDLDFGLWQTSKFAQLHSARCASASKSAKLQLSRSGSGVGSAESTGKSVTACWPGGTRPSWFSGRRRPRKPREIGGSLMAIAQPLTRLRLSWRNLSWSRFLWNFPRRALTNPL